MSTNEQHEEAIPVVQSVEAHAKERGFLPRFITGDRIRPLRENPNHWRLVVAMGTNRWQPWTLLTSAQFDEAMAAVKPVTLR